MAFTGIHVACSYAGANGDKTAPEISVLRPPVWSQAITSAGTTANAAPSDSQELGDPIFTLRAVGGAWWASFGASPGDPANGGANAIYVADGEVISVRANALDKVRVAAA